MGGQTQYIDGANRVVPRVAAAVMTTYSLKAPLATHYRRASCVEVECPDYVNGWASGFNEAEPDEMAAAEYVRTKSGRRFTTHRGHRVDSLDGAGQKLLVIDDVGPLTIFAFEPGQVCFRAASHHLSLEREPFYVVRGGLPYAPHGSARQHADAEDWIDDLATNLDANRQLRENG